MARSGAVDVKSFRILGSLLGSLTFILSAFVAISGLVSFIFFPEEQMYWIFLETFVFGMTLGVLLKIACGRIREDEINFRVAMLVVSTVWFFAGLFGALPFYLSGHIPSYLEAYFETVSGFTTTGATILTDIEAIGKSLLFWRSMTHFIGGVGIIVMALVILPFLNIGGVKLFESEASSGVNADVIQSIRESARRTWWIYLSLNLIMTIFLFCGGMNIFEAVCHAMGTIATGGFSPNNDSIARYAASGHPSALYFELVISFFMLIGAMSFSLHISAVQNRSVLVYLRDAHLKFYLAVIAMAILVTSGVLLVNRVYPDAGLALRHSLFSVISIITTTGFSTEDFSKWPLVTHVILLFLFLIGGMPGSTAGGLKSVRVQVTLLQARIEVQKTIHPRRIFNIKLGNNHLQLETIKNINYFLVLYAFTFAAGVFLLSFTNDNLETVAGAVLSAMSSIGPGTTPSIGPYGSFSSMDHFSKFVLAFLMIAGRLELLPVFALFAVHLWKK